MQGAARPRGGGGEIRGGGLGDTRDFTLGRRCTRETVHSAINL